MKTWNAKQGEIKANWWVVDATDKTVGRLASEVAKVIRGKHRPTFTPHVDAGDHVIVVNTNKLRFSGNKWLQKKYYSHTGFFGSLREQTAQEALEKDSTKIIENAVRGMLPRNRLGRDLIKKLKAYPGPEHPHSAQNPEAWTVN